MPRCAIYLRHSLDREKTENQRPDVEQLVRARGYEIVASFEEGVSSVKKRPEYERMMKAARRGTFDVLVVWALDRFGRSMIGNMNDVLELDRIGVTVVSVRETWMDTSGPTRNLLVAIISWCAEQERNRLIERTKAGLVNARKRGARLGRPPARLDHEQIVQLRDEGWSLRKIATAMNVGPNTIRRHLAAPAEASS